MFSRLFLLTVLRFYALVSGVQQTLFTHLAADKTPATLNSTDIGLRKTEVTALSCARLCVTSAWCSLWLHESSQQECILVMGGASAGMDVPTEVVLNGFQAWVDQCLASDGFQHLPDSNWCVFLEYDTPTSYTGAKELCKAVDSELINLDSEEKFRALQTILTSQNPGMSKYMRVGGYRLRSGGLYDFDLENGRPFPFSATSDVWLTEQPNNLNGTQHCLLLSRDGRFLLHDGFCNEFITISGYVCEKPQG